MTDLASLLARHGSGLVLALSCLLGVGALAMLLSRSPLHRQRVAELTLAAALLASGLLLLPLPRPALGWLTAGGDVQVHAPIVGASTFMPLSPPAAQQIPWAQAAPRAAAVPSEVPDASIFPGAPRLLAQLFLLGAAGFAAHLLLSFVLLRRTLRKAAVAPEWITRLASGSEPDEPPRVLLAKRITRPFCCGLGSGTIVLPANLAQPALRARVEAVLAHERAHLTLRHPRARLLASLVAPFLYWHPLYWWLVRELRRCSELLADDMAAGRQGKRQYVTELLELAESCGRVPAPQALGLGALSSRKDFLVRMETLLMRRTRLSTRSSVLHVATRSICAVLLLGSVSLAWGRPPQDDRSDRNILGEFTDAVLKGFHGPVRATKPEEPPQDHALQTSPQVQRPEDQPGIVATFHFVDPRALGEFFVQCYDAGLVVRMLDLGPPAPETGRRTGHASVHGMNSVPMDFLLKDGVPGLDLTLFTIDGQGFPGARPPRNSLATRVDRMQQELADLQDQIRQMETLRTIDLGLSRQPPTLGYTETVRGLAVAGTLQQLLALGYAETEQGLPVAGTIQRLLAPDYAETAQGLTVVDPRLVQPKPALAIQGTVVSTLGGDQDLIAIDRGSNHGIRVGQTFEIYRESTYKGRVRVTNVSKDLCIGVLETKVKGTARIEQGDKATTRL